MAKGISATMRTLAYYKKMGLPVWKVEQWINIPGHPAGGVRRDLFNCIDIIALGLHVEHRSDDAPRNTSTICGIQSCAQSGFASHLAKMLAEPNAKKWLECGGNLLLMAWEKRKEGTKVLHWRPRIQELTLADFKDVPEEIVTNDNSL